MDEFSDFQMAVQLPSPSIVTMGISPPRFNANYVTPSRPSGKSSFTSASRLASDSSPVHSIANHSNNKSDLISQNNSNTAGIPGPTVTKPAGNVGSRLANYDLGLSFPLSQGGPPLAQNGGQVFNAFANFPKTIMQPSSLHQSQSGFQKSHQDLLIGEEDKYSALRMLVETDISSSTPSVFETPVKPDSESELPPNLSETYHAHSTNQVSSRNEAVKLNGFKSLPSNGPAANTNLSIDPFSFQNGTSPRSQEEHSTVCDSTDFGDFQSCTSFTSTPVPSTTTVLDLSPPVFSTVASAIVTPVITPNYGLSSLAKPLSENLVESESVHLENGLCDSDDGEFGDFISVEPVVKPNIPPILPMSQPNISFWNRNNMNAPVVTPLKQSPPPPPMSNDDKENIQDIMDVGGYFSNFNNPLDSDTPRPEPKPTHLPNESLANCVIQEDFSKFSSSSTYLKSSPAPKSDTDNPLNSSSLEFDTNLFTPPSTSSFIRTSLIRNDKVTEIDPMKWNMSEDEGHHHHTDSSIKEYSSFDKKDGSSPTVIKSKFLDISPETRSVASLDLGNYVSVDYAETGNFNNNNNTSSVYSSSSPQTNHRISLIDSAPSLGSGNLKTESGLLSTGQAIAYDDFDRYQCFREECDNEKERNLQEWSRCLAACTKAISRALAVFNGVSTSEVIREVVADEKGYSYVINILEIYRISQRIQKSAGKSGIESRLDSVFFEINNMWETLSAFLLGTCVSDEIYQDDRESNDDELSSTNDPSSSCGVCLCVVNTSDSAVCLDYGGKCYHFKCANFWVNSVDAILPSLSNGVNLVSQPETIENSSNSFSNLSGRSSSRF